MKKYLIICFSIIFILFGYYYLHFYTSFFLLSKGNVTTNVTIEGKTFKLDDEDFHLKAINFSSFVPGSEESKALDESTYKRWFKSIQEMNINTIRLSSIEETSFYEAFYNYNKNNKDPLYLIQGVDAEDYSKNSAIDYFDEDLKESLIENVKLMVDVIHGRRIITDGTNHPSGNFFHDVSDWTIGYIVGTEWNDITVKYTNEQKAGDTTYKGTYIKTTEDATPFERILAEVGDELFSYESKKYGTQRLVSFGNTPETDPFTYDEAITDYFNKFVTIDIANLQTTNKVKSGLFASFQAYSYYPDYYSMSSEKYEDTYYEYLSSLSNHYEIPVVISDFGYSTSRITNTTISNDQYGKGYYTEEEQGSMIVAAIRTMEKAGINGFIINEWQDNWSKNIWNTMHAVDTTRSKYWHDVQTSTQGYGILSFEPGENEVLVTLDENTDEWKKEDIVFSNGDYTLSLKYDQAYIYMLVQKKGLNFEADTIYIPIDTTSKSGSVTCENESLKFDRAADFLIKIDGKENSKITVQERYNTLRVVYGRKIYLTDPYEKDNIPPKGSSKFEDIEILTGTQKLIYETDGYKIENVVSLVSAGNLNYGTTDVTSEQYNSLSDFYSSDDHIELRIPWQLLNFSDPSEMMIHDDYYENYGVEDFKIDKLYIGVGDGSKSISFGEVELKGWNESFEYHERLKKSYYIIQEALKEVE